MTLKEAIEKKLTKDEREKEIRVALAKGLEDYLIAGCLLTKARKERDWEKDHIAHNFWEWVEKELLISTSNGKRMIEIWEGIQPYLQNHLDVVLQVEFTKLAEIMPILKKVKVKEGLEWLHTAATNSVRDLKRNIVEHKGGQPDDLCDHVRTENWLKCCKCHKFFKNGG